MHGPTRGDRSIDRSFVNFNRPIKESGTLEPLETEDDRQSDHRIAWFAADFPRQPTTTLEYTYRAYTEAGARKFVRDISSQSWEMVASARKSLAKADALQATLDALRDANFKTKRVCRRLTDPPWFNDAIRSLIKKRRKIYDREGRSGAWKR